MSSKSSPPKKQAPIEIIADAILSAAYGDNPPTGTSADYGRAVSRHCGRAVTKALREAGYAIVPVEPTAVMIEAGCDADIPGGRYGEDTFSESSVLKADVPVIWRAMTEAADAPEDAVLREIALAESEPR